MRLEDLQGEMGASTYGKLIILAHCKSEAMRIFSGASCYLTGVEFVEIDGTFKFTYTRGDKKEQVLIYEEDLDFTPLSELPYSMGLKVLGGLKRKKGADARVFGVKDIGAGSYLVKYYTLSSGDKGLYEDSVSVEL